MSLQHFILTRFNVASGGREAQIRKRAGWLERRFDLFENICVPSLAAQTERNFKWLIYFDAATDDASRIRIEECREIVPFEAFFVTDFEPRMAGRDIAERLAPNTHRLLTTRLDNDDAIANFFVSQLQRAAAGSPDETILNYPQGFSLKGRKLFYERDERSAFASLLESKANIRTVWHDQHHRLEQIWDYGQIDSAPAWLQTIHGENVSNRVKGHRVLQGPMLSDFAIATHALPLPSNRLDVVFERVFLGPLRMLRETAIAAIKSLLALSGR